MKAHIKFCCLTERKFLTLATFPISNIYIYIYDCSELCDYQNGDRKQRSHPDYIQNAGAGSRDAAQVGGLGRGQPLRGRRTLIH